MVVSPLDTKLFRDLRRIAGQVITIALVVAAGIAAYVALSANYAALVASRDQYYVENRFADVFARLTRAPEAVGRALAAIEGVDSVETRVVGAMTLDLPGRPDPVSAEVVSLPPGNVAALNVVALRAGRFPSAARDDEALLLEAFAGKHAIVPGDSVTAVVQGRRRSIRVVGIAMSPEYVLAISPTSGFADPEGFAVLWMPREALEPVFDLRGAFNDVVLGVAPTASVPAVRAEVERLLVRYGCRTALGRDKQMSNWALSGELSQLEALATVVPAIFLAVAAFLLHVVLGRIVLLQRPDIATLKALGYPDRTIALHFLKLVSVIVVLGAVVGLGVGRALGSQMLDLYSEFFRFPTRVFRVDASLIATSVLVSLGAAVAGALSTLRSIMRLRPAEAMQPPKPPRYRRSVLDVVRIGVLIGASGRMVLREVERAPIRVLLSALGVAAAIGIVVVGRFSGDAIDELLDLMFFQSFRDDVGVVLFRPTPARAVSELQHLPGVELAEGYRVVPVRIFARGDRAGSASRDAQLWGYPRGAALRRIVDLEGRAHAPAPEALTLTRKLGELLGVGVGDLVDVEIREGATRSRTLPVAALVDEPFGLQAYSDLDSVHRWLGESDTVSMVALRVDASGLDALSAELRRRPVIAGVVRKRALLDRFDEQTAGQLRWTTLILSIFAAVIAIGVVYNNARITLSARERELASLRVLGLTRREVSAILLGELGLQVAVAIPIGLLFGTWWAGAIMSTADPEMYRMPVVIHPSTYAFAVLVAVLAAAASALLVRRRLDRLDLIGVLKTRE